MQYPQLLPKEIRTELDLYRYYRLSFLVHPEDALGESVSLRNIIIRGFMDLRFYRIDTDWEQLERFVKGGKQLGYEVKSPYNISIYLLRDKGKLTLNHRLQAGSYYSMATFSPEAEELLMEKLNTLFKDYRDRTSQLYTGTEPLIY